MTEAAETLGALKDAGGELSVMFYRQIRGALPTPLMERFVAFKAATTEADLERHR